MYTMWYLHRVNNLGMHYEIRGGGRRRVCKKIFQKMFEQVYILKYNRKEEYFINKYFIRNSSKYTFKNSTRKEEFFVNYVLKEF